MAISVKGNSPKKAIKKKKTPPELGEVLSKGQRTPTPPVAIPRP